MEEVTPEGWRILAGGIEVISGEVGGSSGGRKGWR